MLAVEWRLEPKTTLTAMAAAVALQVFLFCRMKDTRPRLAAVSPAYREGAVEAPGLARRPCFSSSSRRVFWAAEPE